MSPPFGRACLDDQTIQTFVEGEVAPDVERAIFRHVDTCEECRELLAMAVEAARAHGGAALGAGETVARYHVLGVIGTGAMGVVYAAYDPKLDRKIALKILRATSEEDREARARRLLDEARAMAKLSDSHVVTVHDVGTIGEHVFVAMEHVDGASLREWLASEARSWRAVIDVFLQAGAGLAAAHAAGIVHRDFKPDNVLVGHDGRARVSDFGLAKASPQPNAAPATHGVGASTVAGTPAYMAPEVLAGDAGDARSDQYSFAVALFEGLYGARPARENAVVPASAPRVPAELRRIVLRALGPRDERYPSMAALLDALRGATSPRRARLAAATIAAVAVVGAAAAFHVAHARRTAEAVAQCAGADRDLVGAWDTERKRAVHAAFAATDAPFAEDAWRYAEASLDGYARAWSDERRSACEATRVHAQQSLATLEARDACLDQQLAQLRALSSVFARADRGVVAKAVSAVDELPAPTLCAKGPAIERDRARRERDPAASEAVAEARRALGEVAALGDAGRYAEGLERAGALLERARGLDDAWLEAWSQFRLGRLQGYSGDPARSEENLLEAASGAAVSGDFALQAEIWMELGFGTIGKRDVPAGERFFRKARLAMDRMESPDALEMRRVYYLGQLYLMADRRNDAVDAFERCRAIEARRDARFPGCLSYLGGARADEGRQGEGIRMRREALDAFVAKRGTMHPQTGMYLNNLGVVLLDHGEHEEALAVFTRSIAVYETSARVDHPDLVYPLDNRALVYLATGRATEALADLTRAEQIFSAGGAMERPEVHAESLVATATALRRERKQDLARAPLQRALDLAGAAHADKQRALAQRERAELELASGHVDAAVESAQHAVATLAGLPASLPQEDVTTLKTLALALHAQGHDAEAVTALERAQKLAESIDGNPFELAATRFLLARVLAAQGRDGARATELALAAADVYRRAPALRREADDVGKWLQSASR